MFKFLRRHKTILMVTLALCILGMLFFGIGGTAFTSSPQDTIAKVNGEKITQGEFDQLYNQISRSRQDLTPQQRQQLLGQTFNELVRQEVMVQEAKRYGIQVTDSELLYHLASNPAFQTDGRFDPQRYQRTIMQNLNMRIQDFEEFRKKDLYQQKLNHLIATSVHIPKQEMEAAFQRRLSLAENAKDRKELVENKEKIFTEIRNQEVNNVFQDWLAHLNSNLKVSIVSEPFRKRLAGQS